jgi:hypothetical protein
MLEAGGLDTGGGLESGTSREATGSGALVRDYALLESALARPPAAVFGQDAYPTSTSRPLRCCTRCASITHWWTATNGWHGQPAGCFSA